MTNKILLHFIITVVVITKTWAQCETASMEGYRGKCDVTATVSKEGKFVYSSSGETIKQWDFYNKTITADWPIEQGVTSVIDVSEDGRYVRFSDKNKVIRLLDTQTGKIVVIGSFDAVHAMVNNMALVSEVKSRTENMTKYYFSKLFAYDVNTGKKKALGDYDKAPQISIQSGRVALMYDHQLSVVDFIKGKEIFSLEINAFTPDFGFSSDGKYVASFQGITDIDTRKVTAVKFSYDNSGGSFYFTPDSKHLFYFQRSSVYQAGWYYGFVKVQKVDVQTGKEEADFSSGWMSSFKPLEQGYTLIPFDNSQFFVFDEKEIALTAVQSIDQKVEKLNLYGNIGNAGQAQIVKEEKDKAFMESLKPLIVNSLQSLTPGDFTFPYRNQTQIYDYNSETGIVLIGDSFQAGVFKMPEGKLINGYGLDPRNMQLGPVDRAVAIGLRIYSGAVSADGTVASFSSEAEGNEVSEVYRNGALIQKIPGVVIAKILNDNQAIAFIPASKSLSLYDYAAKKVIVTYGKGSRDFKLSPDRSKILIVNGSKVYDVQSGKLLLSSKSYLSELTNSNGINYNDEQPHIFDLGSGNELPLKNWNPNLRGNQVFMQGPYIVTFTHDGPLYVFDADKMNYISDRPVLKITENAFEDHIYFNGFNEIFIMNNQGFPAYGIRGEETELATAYCLNATSGRFTPYLWQVGKDARHAIAQKEKAASEPDPQVTSLMQTLNVFPDSYTFNYANFDYLDLTNNVVANKYFTYMGSDKIYAIGKFCPSFGVTKFLMLTIKNPGMNEQYNFSLVGVGPKGFVSNVIIATTQKVNGNVTELANVSIVKSRTNYTINVNTDSPSGVRTKSFTLPGGCN
jgi:WD40 repeat protein